MAPAPAGPLQIRFPAPTQAHTACTMNEERQQVHRVAFLGTHNWRGEAGLCDALRSLAG